MRCISCQRLSLHIVCRGCQIRYLKPNLTKRVLANGLTVYSFYKYDDIGQFLTTKHTLLGYLVYNILAKNSFSIFSKNVDYNIKAFAFPLDDHVRSGYSHTAIIAKYLKSDNFTPIFGKLRASKRVKYSGKSLEFRLKNRRFFTYNYKSHIDSILVDDIITTGTTLSEACLTLRKYDVKVLFALTMADAKNF